MKPELLLRYVKSVNKYSTDIPLEELKSLHQKTHNELRYLWHHGFDRLLKYFDEKYMLNIRIPWCEPYQIWMIVQKTSFDFFHRVILKGLDNICKNYPLIVRTMMLNNLSLKLIPFNQFKEPENRKADIDILFGVDVPHEDYRRFADIFSKMETSSISTAELLKELHKPVSYYNQPWPPKDAQDLPGGDHWPQLFKFPDYKEVEDRIVDLLKEEEPK